MVDNAILSYQRVQRESHERDASDTVMSAEEYSFFEEAATLSFSREGYNKMMILRLFVSIPPVIDTALLIN